MTAPSYTEDLTDINLAEATTDWSEGLDAAWDDGGTPAADGDYPYIQGSLAISQQATKASIASLLYNSGAGITLPTDGAYFVWQIFTSANVLDTKANGGMRVMVGSSTTDFYSWDVGGIDAGRNPYGGWMNHAVNSTVTVDDTVGTPTTTEQYVGAAIKSLTGIGKGNPHAVDALRYGRGSSIFEFGDIGNGYCTFAGYATQNDAAANRWGLIQAIDGGFLYKGKMTLGTVTNAVDFRDSNISILIDNTGKVTAGFNTIEVNNAASRVDWTNVQIASLSTISPGKFIMNANADVNWETCQFTDLGAFTFLSVAVINSATFRRCGLVTTGGAALSSCIFDEASGTVAVATVALSSLSACSFVSDGTGHAVNLGTISSTQSMNWNNDDSGYAATDGSTGNETILVSVDTGVTLTINVGSGYSTPTIKNDGVGTVSVVSGQVTTLVIVKHSDGTALTTLDANVLLEADAGGPLAEGTDIIKGFTDASGEIQDIRSFASNQPIRGWVRKMSGTPFYKEFPLVGTIDNANGLTIIAQLVDDE